MPVRPIYGVGWLGRKDSNLRSGVQSPAPYHLATPQRAGGNPTPRSPPSAAAAAPRHPRGGGRRGGDLLAVDPEHLLLEVLAHLVVERMGDVLERPVLPLLAGHRHEQALGAVDDLDVGHHEAVVEDDGHERLELLVVYRDDLDVGDLHVARSFSSVDGPLSEPATGPRRPGTGRPTTSSPRGPGSPPRQEPAAPSPPAALHRTARSSLRHCPRGPRAGRRSASARPGRARPSLEGPAPLRGRPARDRWRGVGTHLLPPPL